MTYGCRGTVSRAKSSLRWIRKTDRAGRTDWFDPEPERPAELAGPTWVKLEPKRPTEPTRTTRVKPMEVEEVPQRVQPSIHAGMEVSPLEVSSVYKRSRSSSCLPQSEGGPSLSGEPQRAIIVLVSFLYFLHYHWLLYFLNWMKDSAPHNHLAFCHRSC